MTGKVLISLTSIPRRLNGSLVEVLAMLQRQTLSCEILVNIPISYNKWGAEYSVPECILNDKGVTVYSPRSDYGPATKLLGALEYIEDRPDVTHIITVDDDILMLEPRYLENLAAYARVIPEFAVTFGGIRLERFPFRFRDGLVYDNAYCFVDAVSGFRSVMYPAHRLRGKSLPFTFSKNLPPGAANDDDAYFGMLLSEMHIPLFALPVRRGASSLKVSSLEGGSAVVEGVVKERVQNEMELFQFAVGAGYLPNRKFEDGGPLSRRQRIQLAMLRLRGLVQR